MEYWDLYDKNRNKLNKVVKRGDTFGDDEYHLVVNAWIKNSDGKYLITQRSSNKSHPLMWECTGGSALAGETSIEAAIREVKEETGITVSKEDATFLGSTLRYFKGRPDILDVWIFEVDIKIEDVKIQEEEVENVMLATKGEILELKEEGKFLVNVCLDDALNFRKK